MKRLDKLVKIQSGATPSKSNAAFWNGDVPWVSAKDMKRLFLEDTEDHISAAAVDEGARLVASCLSSLEALITAEAQKLEALKTHKKGLMQQLFPAPEEVAA